MSELFYNYPKEISEIFFKAKEMMAGEDWPLLFGPAHIVWEDGNMMDEDIDFCLEYDTGDLNFNQVQAVHWSLHELKKIPIKIRQGVQGE
jgi:hypothetical protein